MTTLEDSYSPREAHFIHVIAPLSCRGLSFVPGRNRPNSTTQKLTLHHHLARISMHALTPNVRVHEEK